MAGPLVESRLTFQLAVMRVKGLMLLTSRNRGASMMAVLCLRSRPHSSRMRLLCFAALTLIEVIIVPDQSFSPSLPTSNAELLSWEKIVWQPSSSEINPSLTQQMLPR